MMNQPGYPNSRPRRLRHHPILRQMVQENHLRAQDLVYPLFVREGSNIRKEVSSMPEVYQLSPDTVVDEVGKALDVGVHSFLLFGIPSHKDATGSSALEENGIVPQAIRAIRKKHGDKPYLITDECFCEYTDHGHCGILNEKTGKLDLDGDATLPLLARQCVVHAQSGADMVAPSGMLDGMVGAIRKCLDGAGFSHMPIMSYSAKYASAYYGPFRDAAESPPKFGDRTTYQMDGANSIEALREVSLDIAEGADIVMVKPAMAYMDIIRQIKDHFQVPVAAYCVSGEYAMIKAAAQKGWVDERRIVLETLLGMKRAGASILLTYHAIRVAAWLKG
jgi:porphobilinogen synthase